jgi:hypothetical protein
VSHLETVLANSHVFATVYTLRHQTTLSALGLMQTSDYVPPRLELKLRSDKRAAVFHLSCLRHTQAGSGIIKSRRYYGNLHSIQIS